MGGGHAPVLACPEQVSAVRAVHRHLPGQKRHLTPLFGARVRGAQMPSSVSPILFDVFVELLVQYMESAMYETA